MASTQTIISSTKIRQGETFNKLSIFLEGDFTTYTPRGEIRKDFLDKNGEVLATFTFDTLVFGTFNIGEGITGDFTQVKPLLTATETQTLPLHRDRGEDGDFKPGRNCWVFEVKLEAPDGTVRTTGIRYLEVLPSVIQ